MNATEDKKAAAKAKREAAKKAARIEAERNQKPVDYMTITVGWTRRGTARADVEVRHKDGSFSVGKYTAGGGGYCKESTVIAEAFNAFLRYKLRAAGIEERVARRDRSYYRNGHRHGFPYGATIGDNAAYAGGIGTGCYTEIAEFIGGKFEHCHGGKVNGGRFDVYRYVDGE